MDNFGSDTNKSSFFITLGDAEFMDDLHVVFGKVIKGDVVLDRLEDEPTHSNPAMALISSSSLGFTTAFVD